jgi:hypothetical protein
MNDLRGRSMAFRATKQLHRAGRALGLATGTEDHDGNIFNHQAGTFERSILAGHLITREERFFYYARQRSQLEVHGLKLNPPLFGLFLGEFYDTYRNGKLMHG